MPPHPLEMPAAAVRFGEQDHVRSFGIFRQAMDSEAVAGGRFAEILQRREVLGRRVARGSCRK